MAVCPRLSGAIIVSGIVGPALLLAELTPADAATASLLLTWEGVATLLLFYYPRSVFS